MMNKNLGASGVNENLKNPSNSNRIEAATSAAIERKPVHNLQKYATIKNSSNSSSPNRESPVTNRLKDYESS